MQVIDHAYTKSLEDRILKLETDVAWMRYELEKRDEDRKATVEKIIYENGK